MKKVYVVGIVIILVMAMVPPAQSFDGQRKGFIMGGGVGLGLTSFTQTTNLGGTRGTTPKQNKGAFITDIKIGFAPDENVEIYYTSKVSWFSITKTYGSKVTIANGSSALGLSYSLKPVAPTYFLSGGIALASWSMPLESPPPKARTGFGIFGGAGYEFATHYSVELNLIYGNPSITEGGFKASTKALTLKLTINALSY